MGSASEGWQAKAAKGKKIQMDSIPKGYLLPEEKLPSPTQKCVIDFARNDGILWNTELLITESTAVALVENIGQGRWTAEEVTVAFLKRATIGQQLLNFATEFLEDRALTRAKQLDAIFRDTGKTVGPLHGIPISVKEHVGIKGRVCHAGFVSWCDYVSPDDASVVQFLHNAGAIIHVRTNEPQSLMHFDSANNVAGRTVNPHNRNLSPGGSSGGEGASIAFKCSALGVGTDLGGSSRVPAAFNGVHALRPTAGRLPLAGLRASGVGQESIQGVIGPLANSLDDIELFMRGILDQRPWEKDASLTPLTWRLVDSLNGLTVGIMMDDEVVHPHPPVTRGLKYAEGKLLAAGVNVIPWEPFKHQEIYDLANSFFSADGYRNMREALQASGEPILPLTDIALNWGNEISVSENWQLNYKREVLRAQYHALMQERGIDLILAPAYVGVAAEHGTAAYTGYTSVWNVLDHPAVVIPAGLKFDESLDKQDLAYKARSELDATEQAKFIPENFTDAPIGLQLVGQRFKDEELLSGAKFVERVILSA